jgi:hypothetical protein
MARQLLVLEEVLAMLQVAGVPARHITAFQAQADAVLRKRPRKELDNVTVASGYGTKSKRGFVELTIDETLTQMDATKAREVGLMLREAAEAATSDEVFVQLLVKLGVPNDPQMTGQVLLDLRELRQGTRGTSYPS